MAGIIINVQPQQAPEVLLVLLLVSIAIGASIVMGRGEKKR
jgi:hypothetical protein